MNIFKSLMYLGGLDPVTSRSFEDEEAAFRPTYGNRVAFERQFGIHAAGKPARPGQAASTALPELCGCG